MATSEPPRRPPLSNRTLVIAAVGIAVVAGGASGAVVHFAGDDSGTSTSSATNCAAVTVAKNVLPSIVTLSVRNGSSSSNGSGETIRDNGYILTNDHVISDGAGGGTIDALFSDGESKRAVIVGRATRLDLAVVKVDVSDKLPTIAFGTSDDLKVGQPVVALGAPLGLEGSVTSGIVSALGRDVPVPAGGGQTAILPGAIQTDASINPGNSGGALVNCAGDLVGINTAIATVPNSQGTAGGGSVGIGFAIPVDLATVVANDLIANGRFDEPFIGVTTSPIPSSVAARFDQPNGLFVESVTAGGPAAQAGLQTGDIITRADGQPTTGPDSLFVLSIRKQPGDKLTLDYDRNGQSHTAVVTVGQEP